MCETQRHARTGACRFEKCIFNVFRNKRYPKIKSNSKIESGIFVSRMYVQNMFKTECQCLSRFHCSNCIYENMNLPKYSQYLTAIFRLISYSCLCVTLELPKWSMERSEYFSYFHFFTELQRRIFSKCLNDFSSDIQLY